MTLKARINNSGQLRFEAICTVCGLPLTNPSAGYLVYRTKGEPRPAFCHSDCRPMFKKTHSSGWKSTPATRLGDDLGF
jgi:hypothetical protein